ncbi:MAG TPA: hypothetical protein VG222_04155, partial [Vicinamibacterales bacterium]|nr:hypothetical protein [Vicinamibacterales bacterium]
MRKRSDSIRKTSRSRAAATAGKPGHPQKKSARLTKTKTSASTGPEPHASAGRSMRAPGVRRERSSPSRTAARNAGEQALATSRGKYVYCIIEAP